MGEFILERQRKNGALFGGEANTPLADRKAIATAILPTLRGIVSSNKRVIAHYTDHEDALVFAGSKWAKASRKASRLRRMIDQESPA